VLVAYALAFLLQLGLGTAYLVVAVLPRAGGNAGRVGEEAARFAFTAPGLFGVALVNAAVLVAVTLVAARASGPGVAARLRLGRSRATLPGMAASVLGMAALMLACGAAAELLGIGQGTVMSEIARVLQAPGPWRLLLAVVAIGIAPGIAEEGFFRGFMLTRLAARWGRWPAIVVTAAAFGLLHMDPVQGSIAFVGGLFLGWVVERFEGLRPGVAAHTFNNAMFVLLASAGSPDERGTRTGTLVVLAVSAAVCAACIAVVRSPRVLRPASS
jgi:membrane protease YdiL (CAAX protease family)